MSKDRRERYPQTQNRMVFKDKDHREIIMDDQYHGAVYIDDDKFPAWRKYKPRSFVFDIPSYSYQSSAYTGAIVSVDTENEYFSILRSYNYNAKNAQYVFGNIYYKNYREGNKIYGYASLNGYDWKKYEVSIYLDADNFIGLYSDGILMRNGNYYQLYKITYDSENYTFSEPTLVSQIDANTCGTYMGQIYNDLYHGGLFVLYRSYASCTIYLVTEDNFEMQQIRIYDLSSRLLYISGWGFYHVNNKYLLFMTYGTLSRPASNLTYEGYEQRVVLYSDTGAPDSWVESTIIPKRLVSNVVDNNTNKITASNKNASASISGLGLYNVESTNEILHVAYIDSIYYVYVQYNYAFNAWMNYYRSGNTKVITGTGSDTLYTYLVVYTSRSLENWDTFTLPTYIDIPFFKHYYITNGRCGYGIMMPNGSGVRFYLDGSELSRSPRGLPPGYYPNQPIYSTAAYAPNPFSNTRPDLTNGNTTTVPQIEIINGKIQQSGNLENNEIWLFQSLPANYYTTFHEIMYICVRIKDPFFRNNSGSYVYLLSNSSNDAGTRYVYENVDPIIDSDYIFD